MYGERLGDGVETQTNVRGEIGGWGRDPNKCTGRDWGMGSRPK